MAYDDGMWVHRYRDGAVVDTALTGRTPHGQDGNAEDVFLFGHRPGPGDTVVDLGAGIGGEVRLFSRLVGPAGRVVAVEAHPRTFACLRRAVEENGLANVTAVHCAAVGEPGTVYLEDGADGHLTNGLTADPAGLPVTGRTLEEILDRAGVDRVGLLKMNIEGAELPVLEGALGVLKRVDNLVVSCHDFLADAPGRQWQRTFDAVVGLLRQEGYHLRTRPHDPRPWVRWYVYASRP
ncbi:FkbM family methyltransferase [Micromonospora okii]|uniref:FkbM family methyltransferase n=1 Tax=Micromonospora okii TaxID=1182970 RepID=UPI001E3E92AF|nr:FkbM family methyltransferase [Micromonospora okii]